MLRMEIALFLVLALHGAFLLPISYVETPQGSYSAGALRCGKLCGRGILSGAVRGAAVRELAEP